MAFRLKYYNIRIPLVIPFRTSFGTTSVRDAILFQLSDGNVTAYSEAVTSSLPDYGYEDNGTVLHIVREFLADKIRDYPRPEEFLERVASIKGNNMAKAAIEMLLWDFHSKKGGTPLYRALGDHREDADVGISIGMTSTPKMLELVKQGIDRGYKRIKVKIERGREEDILSSIRKEFPDVPLSADANCNYTLKDIGALKKIDDYNLEYLEQPLGHDDVVDHAELASRLSTPICLDESITSSEITEKAFEIGACSIVNIKPGRVSGLTESLKIAKIAHDNGGHVWVGGMLETGIGRAFNVSFAANKLVDLPGDTSPNDKYFVKDIVTNPFTLDSGKIRPNSLPGIGVDIDHKEFLDRIVKSDTLISE